MDMYQRLCKPLKSNSFFLFGARGTGKSTLLKEWSNGQISEKMLWIDLLVNDDFERFSERPDLLFEIVESPKNSYDWVVIDEIQKAPKLLDVIHRQIENGNHNCFYAMTGSSARKLKKGASNLLAGRAFTNNLYPLCYSELGTDFNLDVALNFGMLPTVWNMSEDIERSEFLRSYYQTYLKEEVWQEQLIKDLVPFRRFLEVAAQLNGEIVNYSKTARAVGCDTKTIQNYFSILEETLVAFQLDSYHSSIRKRIIQSPKFYFFDTGVKRAMDKTLSLKLAPSNFSYGKAFEHFIITQLMFLADYQRKDFSFCYLKTKDGAEIDLIIERPGLPTALIEIKSTGSIVAEDYRHLLAFKKDLKNSEAFCLSLDPYERVVEGINILPWKKGFLELGVDAKC